MRGRPIRPTISTLGDVAALPFPDDSFDLIVSFETLEHVQDAPAALAEFRRVLAPDGLLIASTPNAERYMVDNEFHEREFTQQEFEQLLAPHFDEVRMFHQQDWLTSAVLGEEQLRQDDPEHPLQVRVAKVAGAEPTDQLFSVAVCGPWSDAVEETAVITGIFEAQKTVEWVDRALEAEHRYRGIAEGAGGVDQACPRSRAPGRRGPRAGRRVRGFALLAGHPPPSQRQREAAPEILMAT